MKKSTSFRLRRCVLLYALVVAALCAAWCVAAATDDNVPAAAALSASADSSSSDGRCATASDCYTGAQTVYIQNVFSALRSSLQNTGWPALPNFCNFSHVTCWPSGVVVNFTGVGLVGTLPPLKEVSVADLPATPITAMIFDNNSGITGTLSSNFGYMTHMKTFSATETGLDGTLPETWSAMTGLQVLRLSNTPVTGTLPASWSALIHLTTVALDNTSLSGTLPAEWSTMTSLTSFTAARTKVNGTLPETWSAMAALQMLSVNETQINGTLPALWSSLKAMRSISIANTTVSGTLPPEWGNLTSLVTFDAAGTALNGTLPTSWSTMTALQVLRLNDAPVSGTIPESWSAMRNLTTVSLAGTNITGCLPASWADVLGLNATDVGLPEMTVCIEASKHKSKMPWWAILILVLGLVFVAAALTLAILWCKSKLPCQKSNDEGSVQASWTTDSATWPSLDEMPNEAVARNSTESTAGPSSTNGSPHCRRGSAHDTPLPRGNVDDAPLAAALAAASGAHNEAAVQDIQQFLAGEQTNSRSGPGEALEHEMLQRVGRSGAQNFRTPVRDDDSLYSDEESDSVNPLRPVQRPFFEAVPSREEAMRRVIRANARLGRHRGRRQPDSANFTEEERAYHLLRPRHAIQTREVIPHRHSSAAGEELYIEDRRPTAGERRTSAR